MLYSSYSLNTERSKFEKKLIREEDNRDDAELREIINDLESNYFERKNTKFKMNTDPTNLSRALDIDGLEDFYSMGSGKIHVDFIWTNNQNITKAAIQYKNKMYFLTEGDTIAGGIIARIAQSKLIFKKDGEAFEHVIKSQ